MPKVLLIDLNKSSHKLVDFQVTDPLVPVSTPLFAALIGKIPNNNFVVVSKGILAGKNGVGLSDAFLLAVSPQSGGIIESKIQGRLANTLESIGIDALVLLNRSNILTGVRISSVQNLKAEFVPALDLAGKSVWETIDKVSKDNSLSTLAISSFGEKGVSGASVVCDYGFATSQGGLGAVFGKMNLKYLNFEGTVNNLTALGVKKITSKYMSGLEKNPLTKSEFDPPGFGLWANKSLVGYMAGNNFGNDVPKAVADFEPQSFLPYLKDTGSTSCPGCPQQCLKSYLVNSGPIDGGRQHQLSVTALLSQFGISNTEKLIEFNSYCHEVGLEHIYIVALLNQEHIDIDLPIKEMVNKVAHLQLTSHFNQIKGMAIPPWDGRGNQGLFLAMALNPSGPRYDVIEHDIDFDPNWAWSRHVEFGEEYGIPKGGLPLGTLDDRRKASILSLWLLWSALDSLGICIYAAPPTRELRSEDILELIFAITGSQIEMNDLFAIGLKRLLIQREINNQLGVSIESDSLPDIFFEVPIKSSSAKLDGAIIDRKQFNYMKSEIIKALYWNEDGGVDETTSEWKECKEIITYIQSRIEIK
jgi:aldehyde:ferredoxin oxidoreductase